MDCLSVHIRLSLLVHDKTELNLRTDKCERRASEVRDIFPPSPHYMEMFTLLLEGMTMKISNIKDDWRAVYKTTKRKMGRILSNLSRSKKFPGDLLLFVCFSNFLPLERLGGLESHIKVAVV